MYYDLEAPGGTRPQPPFRVDVVTGWDAAAGPPAGGPEAVPLAQLYFCDGCSRVVSRRDLAEDVDSYYCPNCLELMPSSEAMLYGIRCSKCWECPVCGSTLTTTVVGAAGTDQTYHLSCSYCRWSSRGRFEAPQPEQLFAKVVAVEREGEPKQRMAALVEAFRARAQEQQRERELAQRLRRRSSIARGSFAASSIGAYTARRFSSAMMLRAPRVSLHHRATGPLDGESSSGTGPWRLEDLQAKLNDHIANSQDLRAEARAALKASSSQPPSTETPQAEAGKAAATARRGAAQQSVPELPVLEGLTVEDLLRLHTEPGPDGRPSLFLQMQRSLEEDVERGTEGVATLQQRLHQITSGYARPPGQPPAFSGLQPAALRPACGQAEAPLQHGATWALLPVRKPLLTKRSRRCRLPARRVVDAPAAVEEVLTGSVEGAEATAEKETAESPEQSSGLRSSALAPPQTSPSLRSSARSSARSEASVPGSDGLCRSIVVKPQINPCFNPPFQKNNTAVAHIPRCIPWMWFSGTGPQPSSTAALAAAAAAAASGGGASAAAAAAVSASSGLMAPPTVASLKGGEEAQLVFTMSNPLETDVELRLDPCAFNAAASIGGVGFEQNVEVLTKPFETALSRYNDLADVHEVYAEETERMKTLKAQDDPDVIPERRLHKILVRLRFRGLATPAELGTTGEDEQTAPWAFFARATLLFTDSSNNKHKVQLLLRFAAKAPHGAVPGGAALLGEIT